MSCRKRTTVKKQPGGYIPISVLKPFIKPLADLTLPVAGELIRHGVKKKLDKPKKGRGLKVAGQGLKLAGQGKKKTQKHSSTSARKMKKKPCSCTKKR